MKTLLFGPREEILFSKELEYREINVKTYKELMEVGSIFGTDYTVLKEFLGIACIAAMLRLHGYEADILIAGNENMSDDQLIAAIVEASPDVLGISLLYDLQLYNALIVARTVKEQLPLIKILFGGAFATVEADVLIERFDYIDFVIRGEGELAIIALYNALKSGEGIENIRGLSYRREGKIISNRQTEFADLDELPPPARDILFDMKNNNIPITTAYIYSSRGCRGTCTFCTVPNLNRKYKVKWRYKNPVLVVDEIEELISTFNVNFFYFTDDNFYGYSDDNEKRLRTFADEIIKRNLKIQFHAECRVDSLNEKVILKLKRAGLRQLLLGIESGSNTTLHRWGKQQTVANNEQAIAIGRKYNFELMPSIILLDWESTMEELKETVVFIERNKIYKITYPLSLVNKLHVLKGSSSAIRYEKTHTIDDKFEITDNESLHRWIVKHTCQDIKIKDIYVAAFWKYLSKEVNRWYLISQELLPQYLLFLRKNRRKYPEAMDFISRCRHWRSKLGINLQRLMNNLIDELFQLKEKHITEIDLKDKMQSWGAEWEREIFFTSLEEELIYYKGKLSEHGNKHNNSNI